MKELLKAIEGKKEEAIQSYYEYLMQCDREGKEVDYFQLGVLHGESCAYKKCIKVIQQQLKKQEDLEITAQSEFDDFIKFLEILGVSDIIVVGMDADSENTHIKNQIKVGDYVKIVREELTYDKCAGWKILKGYETDYLWGSKPVRERTYKVLRIELVEYMLKTHGIALIQHPDTKQVYIIDIRGIEKVYLIRGK